MGGVVGATNCSFFPCSFQLLHAKLQPWHTICRKKLPTGIQYCNTCCCLHLELWPQAPYPFHLSSSLPPASGVGDKEAERTQSCLSQGGLLLHVPLVP